MPELVALDLPAGPALVEHLRRAWADGDAVTVLDRRLPPDAARTVREALRPGWIIGPDGTRRPLKGGRPTEPGDALVVATSGSTGAPKAAVLDHDAVAASARATSQRLGVDPARHRWLACLPLAHVGGLSVVTRAVLTGTPVTVLDGFSAEEVSALGGRGQATHISVVATALRRIDPTAFHCVLLGGAAPPGDLPDNVVTTYGLTETGSGVVYDGVPLAGVEVAIGSGTPGGGAAGEVLLRAPMLLRAYRDGTVPFVVGPDGGGGWFPTGDAGRLGPDGRLHVDGRMAEVVVTGGEKVWPAAVERVLADHPGVAEVAVWKRPDPEWGERVVAWVVVSPDATPVRPEQLLADFRARVRDELAAWAAPKELVLIDHLPRTSSGKVRRAGLTELHVSSPS